MAYCADGCYFHVDENGRLSIGATCTAECILGCFEVVDVPTPPLYHTRGEGGFGGQSTCEDDCLGEHFGSSEQWPKRYDTHYIRDNTNKGYHVGGDPLSDDPTFIASTQGRAFVPSSHPTPIITGPSALSYNDPSVATYAANSVQFFNDYGCPVIVMVEASNWYHDLSNLPLSSQGGARWTGEVRVRTNDAPGGPRTNVMEWQRAFETVLTRVRNNEFVPDGAGIMEMTVGSDSFVESLEAMFNSIKGCLVTTANELQRQFGSYTVEVEVPAEELQDPSLVAPVSDGGYVFPVQGFNWTSTRYGGDVCSEYNDTRGCLRTCCPSGGRRHAGIDLCAPQGTPLFAVTSGVWNVTSDSCGNARLNGDDGNTYVYLHMHSITAASGTRVAAGAQVGTCGDTCFESSPDHLHFEFHPGGYRSGCRPSSRDSSSDPRPFLQAIVDAGGSPGTTSPVTPAERPAQVEDQVVTNQAVFDTAETVRVCAGNIDAGGLAAPFTAFANAVIDNDFQLADNTSFSDRLVKTGGSWQMPILLRPGQGINVETRSRFSKWSYVPFIPATGRFFRDAGGSARAGKITLKAFPVFGGRICGDERFSDGPWWGQLPVDANAVGTYGN